MGCRSRSSSSSGGGSRAWRAAARAAAADPDVDPDAFRTFFGGTGAERECKGKGAGREWYGKATKGSDRTGKDTGKGKGSETTGRSIGPLGKAAKGSETTGNGKGSETTDPGSMDLCPAHYRAGQEAGPHERGECMYCGCCAGTCERCEPERLGGHDTALVSGAMSAGGWVRVDSGTTGQGH